MYVRVIITCQLCLVCLCVCVIITCLFCLQTTLATFLARATTIPSPTVAMTTARRSGCVPCRARRSRKPRAAPSPPAYRIITPNIKARPPSQSSASLCLSPPPQHLLPPARERVGHQPTFHSMLCMSLSSHFELLPS